MKPRLFTGVLALLMLADPAAHASGAATWRGVNIGPEISNADLAHIHDIGFNVVRLSMNRQPLMQKQAPYAFDEAAFARMKSIVDASRANGLRVVLDPHTTPGTAMPTTTLGSDQLWRDRSYQDLLVRLWGRISKTYGDDPTVVGYDLLNEPSAPGRFNSAWGALSWNDLAASLVHQIRQNDHKTTIIVESSTERAAMGGRMDRIDSVQSLKLPADGNIALSLHVYVPKEFTYQGVRGRPTGIAYPGRAGSAQWDRAALEAKLKPVQQYAAAHHVEVFIGEFSVSRYADPASAGRYLGDLVGIFGKFGWGWAYQSYNGAFVWSLEEKRPPAGQAMTQAQVAGTPSRIDLFKQLLKAPKGA